MNIAAVSAQIRDVYACLTVPYLDVFIYLAAGQKYEIVSWVETDRSNDGLVPLKSHFE